MPLLENGFCLLLFLKSWFLTWNSNAARLPIRKENRDDNEARSAHIRAAIWALKNRRQFNATCDKASVIHPRIVLACSCSVDLLWIHARYVLASRAF